MSWSDSGQDAFATQLYAQKRIPIVTHATVQMQSDAVESDVLVSMPGMGNGGVPTDPGMPEVDAPPFPECLTAGCTVVATGPSDDGPGSTGPGGGEGSGDGDGDPGWGGGGDDDGGASCY